ncbi:MAG: hypothetical protein HY847_13265 [Betaproteobacteria bacterium]|nr:hypothetical protein [Betaproteobacteria bacterium]
MATNSISSSASTAQAALQIRPKNPAEQQTRSAEEAAAFTRTQQQQVNQSQQAAPVTNDRGQTTGRIVNVTA